MGRELLGQQSIFTEARRLRVLLNQGALPPGSTAGEWANIILIRSNATSSVYPVTDQGLTDALAAGSSGDMVWVPPATFTTDYVIPAGIGLASMGNKTIIQGQATLGNNSFLLSMIVLITYNQAGTATGVIGPGSGTAYLDDTSVLITNTGAGDVHAVAVSEGGDIEMWACDINGNASGGGDGYGIVQTSGDAFVITGRVRGSTAPFSGTVQEFSFKNEIQLLDGAGALVRLYPATDAGLTAALSAAARSDVIQLPVGTISGNHTLGVDRTLRGIAQDHSILSGTLTTAGSLENLTVNGSASPQATMTGGTIRRCNIITSSAIALTQTGGLVIDVKLTGNSANITWSVSGGSSGRLVRTTGGVDCAINSDQGLKYCSAATTGSADSFNLQTGTLSFCLARTISSGRGFVKSNSGTAQLYNSKAFCDSGDELVVLSGGTLRIGNVKYDSATISGTLIYERGDRGAYEVETFHAEDIEDGTETRHTPATVAQGDMIVADNNPYWTVLTVGVAGTILHSDGTDPAWTDPSAAGIDFDDLTGDCDLADLADYTRGYIIRGGAADWEAYDANNIGFILVGDGTDIASVAFDWDTLAVGAGADMVHNHTIGAEGGAASLHEEIHNEDHTAACDGAKVNFITANEFESERTQVYLNGARQRIGSGNDYTEDATLDAITLDEAPLASDILIIDYVAA